MIPLQIDLVSASYQEEDEEESRMLIHFFGKFCQLPQVQSKIIDVSYRCRIHSYSNSSDIKNHLGLHMNDQKSGAEPGTTIIITIIIIMIIMTIINCSSNIMNPAQNQLILDSMRWISQIPVGHCDTSRQMLMLSLVHNPVHFETTKNRNMP